MASQHTTRAVARVSAGGASGTAFIVSLARRQLLTARHCVEDDARALVQRVELAFYDPDSAVGAAQHHPATATVTKAGGGKDDWALLELDAGSAFPDWATELRLLRCAPMQDHPWSTYGFPWAGDGKGYERGQPLRGAVIQSGVRPYLLDDHQRGQVVQGVSGAPLVIEEHAVGIIIRASQDDQGIATTGMLYALPFSESPALVRELAIAREPPFCDHTTSEVSHGQGLPAVARAIWELEICDPIEGISRVDRLIALWLLHKQIPGALKVAEEAALPRPEARNVIEFAACQWFPIGAAEALAARLVGAVKPRVVSVESNNLDLISRFVRRAGFEHGRSVVWHRGHISLPRWTPGQSREELAAQLAAELLVKLAGARFTANDAVRALGEIELAAGGERDELVAALIDDARKVLAGWAREKVNIRRPACLFVSLSGTSDEDIEYVQQLFPDLGIIVCGPPSASAPAVTDDAWRTEARRRAEEYDAALRELAAFT